MVLSFFHNSVKVDQLVLNGILYKLCCIFESKLLKDVSLVSIHRLDADEQNIGNFMIAFTGRDQCKNFLLALGQIVGQRDFTLNIDKFFLFIKVLEYYVGNSAQSDHFISRQSDQ